MLDDRMCDPVASFDMTLPPWVWASCGLNVRQQPRRTSSRRRLCVNPIPVVSDGRQTPPIAGMLTATSSGARKSRTLPSLTAN